MEETYTNEMICECGCKKWNIKADGLFFWHLIVCAKCEKVLDILRKGQIQLLAKTSNIWELRQVAVTGK